MTAVRGGRIVAVQPGQVRVTLDPSPGCGGCACTAGPARPLSVPWKGAPPPVGGRVEISFPPAAGEAFRVLVLPLAAAIAASALALAWMPAVPAGSVVAFVVALGAAGIVARRARRGNLPSSVVSDRPTDDGRDTAFNQP